MKLIPIAALSLTAVLLVGPAAAQQVAPATHGHATPTPPAGGMMEHDKMMTEMKAADARLEALALTMKSARGDQKALAMQELLTELVRHQVDVHRQTSMMHDYMMSQMPHK